MRHGDVCVDEDEDVTLRMACPCVPGSRNSLNRLADHSRAPTPGDGRGLVPAVVVYDDRVDVDAGAGTQLRGGSVDRVQGRRQVGLFVEGRDDYRELSGWLGDKAGRLGTDVRVRPVAGRIVTSEEAPVISIQS